MQPHRKSARSRQLRRPVYCTHSPLTCACLVQPAYAHCLQLSRQHGAAAHRPARKLLIAPCRPRCRTKLPHSPCSVATCRRTFHCANSCTLLSRSMSASLTANGASTVRLWLHNFLQTPWAMCRNPGRNFGSNPGGEPRTAQRHLGIKSPCRQAWGRCRAR